jgi:hypothetical protein
MTVQGVPDDPVNACTYGLHADEVWCGGVSTGTNRWPPANHWWMRAVAQFNYRPHVDQQLLVPRCGSGSVLRDDRVAGRYLKCLAGRAFAANDRVLCRS